MSLKRHKEAIMDSICLLHCSSICVGIIIVCWFYCLSDWVSPALCKFLLLHCKLVNFTLDHLIWLFNLSGQTVDNDDSWHRPVDNCIALLWLSYFVTDRGAYIKAWITKSYQTTLNHLSPKTLQSELRWRATEENAKNLSSKWLRSLFCPFFSFVFFTFWKTCICAAASISSSNCTLMHRLRL